MAKKIKKAELVDQLYRILDDRHWDLFSQLLGRELNRAPTSRTNFLSSLFKKTIGVSSRKSKGRELQKFVANEISKLTGIPCGKDEGIESRGGGQCGTDVRLSKQALKLFAYSVECKNCESWSLPAFIAQAKRNQLPNTDWLVFLSKNNHEEIVVLDAKAFFRILKGKK
jgi:hypothetical protein